MKILLNIHSYFKFRKNMFLKVNLRITWYITIHLVKKSKIEYLSLYGGETKPKTLYK